MTYVHVCYYFSTFIKMCKYLGNEFVKQDSLTRDFPHNIFRISHDSKHGVINHILQIILSQTVAALTVLYVAKFSNYVFLHL